MKTLATRINLTWLLLVTIAFGAIAVIWLLVTSNAPPSNAVLIDGVGAGRAGKSSLGLPSSANAVPTATTYTINIGNGQGGAPKGGIAQQTPGTILDAPTPTPATITVYVSGAVARPGVYTLADGARVQDAIATAGGAMIQADLDGVNLAQRLADEAHVTIGRRDEGTKSSIQQPAASIDSVGGAPVPGQSLSQPAGAKPTPSAPININTATAAELETLPGVGPSLAARIVADREKYGPYRTVEDLMRVSGIKEGILSKIRDYITVGQ